MPRFFPTRSRTLLTALGLLSCLLSDLEPLRAQGQATRQARRPVPVIWVIGQSNAHGSAFGYWLSNPVGPGAAHSHLAATPGVKTWWPGRSVRRPSSQPGWEPYRTGSIAMVNNSTFWIDENRFGPEASLAGAARNHFGEVYLYKFCWVARLDPRAVPTFSRGATAHDGLYGLMMQNWNAAANALREQGLEPDIKGIFWVQGEGDTRATGQPDLLLYARAYEPNLTRFIADLRGDLPQQRYPIPFVISQLHDQHIPRSVWEPGETLVRAAQAQVAANDEFTVLCPTDGLTIDNDQGLVHFDGQGLVDLGYRLFRSVEPFHR